MQLLCPNEMFFCLNKSFDSGTVSQNSNGIFGDPERIRTSDLLIRSQPLYPAELRGLI